MMKLNMSQQLLAALRMEFESCGVASSSVRAPGISVLKQNELALREIGPQTLCQVFKT
jgi:hypothetical protein